MVRYEDMVWYGKTRRLTGEEQYAAVCTQERCVKALSFAFMLSIMRQATKINPYMPQNISEHQAKQAVEYLKNLYLGSENDDK